MIKCSISKAKLSLGILFFCYVNMILHNLIPEYFTTHVFHKAVYSRKKMFLRRVFLE